ncbi:MAG: manganese efflux pump MntP family protein [Clostridiales bacterium]|nr:manganese efflux pump MntP family protein [Clostridiales bacterium]
MSFFGLVLLAIGLSMDAFAAAVCAGLTMTKVTIKKALIIGLYFGVFQAVMPLLGYIAAVQFTDMMTSYSHWVAFALLCIISGKMIIGSFKKEGCPDRGFPAETETSLKPARMLPLAVATSIDALTVGVSFAFLKGSIVTAVSLIGITTLAISMAGVKVGNAFGEKFSSKAELAGGIILLLIGLKVLLV